MAWYPDAIKRDIGRGRYAHTPVRFVLHTAVVNAGELKPDATGSLWHFYVGPTGTVYQYVDTAMRAGAETYPGSVGSISVETWDGYREDANRRPIPLDAYGVTGWRSTSDIPAWTAAQVASLAKLWAWLADRGTTIRSAPQSSARSAPLKLGTSTEATRPGSVLAWASTSAVSASWGSRRAGTKEPTSISRWPAAKAALIHSILCAVDTTVAMLCRPSRRPTSRTMARATGGCRSDGIGEVCTGCLFRVGLGKILKIPE